MQKGRWNMKKWTACVLTAAMISGNMGIPVYAGETSQTEEAVTVQEEAAVPEEDVLQEPLPASEEGHDAETAEEASEEETEDLVEGEVLPDPETEQEEMADEQAGLYTEAEAGEDFTINSDGILTKYNGSAETVYIPSSVVTIGNSAFAGNTNLMTVFIPSSVTFIGDQAFANCTVLSYVNGGDSITYLSSNTFQGCSSIVFHTASTVLRDYANKNDFEYIVDADDSEFEWAGHRYKIFNEAVTPLEAKAKCEALGGHLATISFEEERQAILAAVKKQADSYNSYIISGIREDSSGSWYWDSGEPVQYTYWQHYYSKDSGNNIAKYYAGYTCGYFIKDHSVPAHYYSIPEIGGYQGAAEDRVHSHYMGFQVKEYSRTWFTYNYAFSYPSWTEGSMFQFNDPMKEDRMGYICEWGDNFPKITAVYDSENKTIMLVGEGDMQDYTKETCVNAPWRKWLSEAEYVTCSNGVTSIGNYAFYQAPALTDFEASSAIKKIGKYALAECNNLNSVTADYVQEIGYAAFDKDNSLVFFEVPYSLTTAESIFGTERETAINISFDECKKIPEKICQGCRGLYDVTIGYKTYEIGYAAFKNCPDLESVSLQNVETIGNSAFEGCISLATMTIPNTVKNINSKAFYGCGLYKVEAPSTARALESGNEFDNNSSDLTFIIYAVSVTGYTGYWEKYIISKDANINPASYLPSDDGWKARNDEVQKVIGEVGEDLFYRLYDPNNKKSQKLFQGTTRFKTLRKIGEKGACFGMCAASILNYENRPPITDWNAKFTKASQVDSSKLSLNSDTMNISLSDWIAIAHLWQGSTDACRQLDSNMNRYKKLLSRLSTDTPTPTLLQLYNFGKAETNHVVVAYRAAVANGKTVIYVYDPNGTGDSNRIIIDGTGLGNRRYDWKYCSGPDTFTTPVGRSDISFIEDLSGLYEAVSENKKVGAKNGKLYEAEGAELTAQNTDSNTVPVQPAGAAEDAAESLGQAYYADDGAELTFTGTGEESMKVSVTSSDTELSVVSESTSEITFKGGTGQIEAEITDGTAQTEITITDLENNETVISGEADGDITVSKDDNTGRILVAGYNSFNVSAETEDDTFTRKVTCESAETVYEVALSDDKLEIHVAGFEIGEGDVSIAESSYPFKGIAITPEVTVIFDGRKLVEDKDYTVSYSDNTRVGTASVTVIGAGLYSGTVVKTFEIVEAEIPALTVEIRLSLASDEAGTFVTTVPSGTETLITADASGGSGTYSYKFLMYDNKEGVWYRLSDYSSSNTYLWKPETAGTKTIFADIRDGSGFTVRAKLSGFKVTEEQAALSGSIKTSLASDSSGTEILTAPSGTKILITAKGAGGSGSYTYKFLVYDNVAKTWYKFRDFTSTNTYTWTTGAAGTKTLFADIQDGTGETVRVKLSGFVVTEKSTALAGTIKASLASDSTGTAVTTAKSGTKVLITANGSGGSGPYTYKFLIYDNGADTWFKLRDFTSTNTYTWTPGATGTKTLFVDIRDSAGKTVRVKLSGFVVTAK